jgi:GNAT superfamily N-acetyltransferase
MDRKKNLSAFMRESHAVDESGNPLRLYHGTADDFSEFRHGHPNKKDAGWLGRGFYFTNSPAMANSYAMLKPGKAENVMPVHLSLKNPFYATMEHKTALKNALMDDPYAAEEFRNKLMEAGHDGVILDYGTKDNVREYVAFDPTQIKSATGNQGTFDPSKPDITKNDGGGVKGYIPHDDERRAKNLADFHGETPEEIKTARWFHGTNKDFSSFQPRTADAIYVTQSPAFAQQFSKQHMESWHESAPAPPKGWAVNTGAYAKPKVHAPNIMPVHVRAEKPFDYENPKHVKDVVSKLGYLGLSDSDRDLLARYLPIGDWESIESGPVQDVLKASGYDSFFVEEDGHKNLAVYKPEQIKSATGNQGTFDSSNPDITKRYGGDVEGLEPSIDMSIDKQNNRLSAKAIDDWNKAIGHATFNIGDNNELDPQHVEVHEDYRKSGIAKKLYDHVARRGYKINRSSDQTDAGNAFWNKHQGLNKVWRVQKEGGGALNDEGITAYHGSPHDFEQFDTSKIGTGEGNQSFGHGLYFAGNENVARNYRDRLGRQEETSGETMADQYVIPRHFYQDTSEEELAENMKEAARWSEQQIFDQGKMHYVFDDDSMLIHDDDEVRAVQKHPGHMYEVHIKAHPDHMLDWDAPLSEQSEHVKNALLNSGHDFHQIASDMFDGKPEDLRGADIYQWLSGEHEGGLGSPKNVTDHFSEKGIRGIRYLDAGSRGMSPAFDPSYLERQIAKNREAAKIAAPSDLPEIDEDHQTLLQRLADAKAEKHLSRNYVVFDHNHVAVKRKYARGGVVG